MLKLSHATCSKKLRRMLFVVEEGQEALVDARGCSNATGETEQNISEKGSNVEQKIGCRRVQSTTN
jgi:hypothetical protein